jgi:hypothetical protein
MPRHAVPNRPGPQGVALDFATGGHEVPITRDRKGLASSLIEMAAARREMMRMPALSRRQRQPAQEARDLAVTAMPEDPVEVIGHDTGGEPAEVEPRDGLGKARTREKAS